MSLITELGLDPENFDWQDLALCKSDPDSGFTANYYERYEKDPIVAANVDKGCEICPVRKACLQQGIEGGETGVWGGWFLNGAGKVDKIRNAHKTPEQWEELKELLS